MVHEFVPSDRKNQGGKQLINGLELDNSSSSGSAGCPLMWHK